MLEWLGELKEEERIRAIRDAFARVASTEDGKVVFAVLLEQLYFFRPCLDEASTALANFAKEKLLKYFGEEVDLRIVEAIIRSPERKMNE